MVAIPKLLRERRERVCSQFRGRIAKKMCGTELEEWCLIGKCSHVSGDKKSGRE
jgi:hypothetical protein